MSEYRPIETAPTDGRRIIGIWFDEYPAGDVYVDGAVIQWEGGSVLKNAWAYAGWLVRFVDEGDPPTHWLPLPDAFPEGVQEKGSEDAS